MNLETISQVYDVVSSVVGTAAVIAAVTPTPKDDTFLSFLRKVLDIIGFNIMNAKNK